MNVDCAVLTARLRRLAFPVAMPSSRSAHPLSAPPARTLDSRCPRRGCEGRAALEFALSSLLFLSLVFGLVDLGRLVFLRTMLTNSVREATRQAAITPGSTADIVAAAAQRSPTLSLSASNFTITCTNWSVPPSARSCASGSTSPPTVTQLDKVGVCASYTFTVIAPRIVGRSTIAATECEYASVR
jgi:Flp pilus assembly protein TadG